METKVIVLTKEGEPKETDITYPGTKLIGAKCTVYRKDMSHNITVSVKIDEYNSNKSNWRSMPETMIKKVAEAHALRRAFSIHGVYIPEEFDQADNIPKAKGYEVKDAAKKEKKRELVKELPGDEQTKIKAMLIDIINEVAELTETPVETLTKEELDNKPIDDLYVDEAREVYKKLMNVKKQTA
jgi:soluble P-type ATPase